MLPSISTPLLIMMFRQSAKSFPLEIIEAATTISFMNAWNNYLWPRVILTKSTAQTMPMMISSLTSGYHTDYGMLMLAVFITTLPTAVVFFILQKNFAEGITGVIK